MTKDSLEDIIEKTPIHEKSVRDATPGKFRPLKVIPGKYVPIRSYVTDQMIRPGYNAFIKYRNNMRKR